MRCELMQIERMSLDERFGSITGDAMRLSDDIRRRMRRERMMMAIQDFIATKTQGEELNESVSDQC